MHTIFGLVLLEEKVDVAADEDVAAGISFISKCEQNVTTSA